MNINKLILTSIVGITAVTGAFAEEPNKPKPDETLDYQTVTSRKYVDVKLDEKQNNIAVTKAPFVYDEDDNPAAGGSLVETTNTVGGVDQRGIFNGADPDDYKKDVHAEWVPTMGAMMTQLAAVADQIPTLPTGTEGKVPVYNASGKLGTVQRPVLSWSAHDAQNPNSPSDEDGASNYSTSFTQNTAKTWPKADEDALVDTEALAYGLALKQNIITKRSSGDPVHVLTDDATKDGTVNKVAVATEPTYTNGSLDNGDDIPNVQMVMNEVAPVIWSVHDANNPNAANDEDATKAYSIAFNNTKDNWPTADKDKLVDTEALAKALALKQNKKTCVQWVVYNEQTDQYTEYNPGDTIPANATCWLWEFDGNNA